MARYTACEGTIKAGDTPTVVGQVISWSLEESNNVKSFFELGNCNEQNAAGGTTRSASLEVNFDPDDGGQDEFTIGATVAVEIYPLGDTSGLEYYDMSGIVESLSQSASGDDFITQSIGLKVNSLTRSNVV